MILYYVYNLYYNTLCNLGPNTSRPVSKTSDGGGMLTSLSSSVTAALTGGGTGGGSVTYPEKRRRRPSLVREKDMNKPASRLV